MRPASLYPEFRDTPCKRCVHFAGWADCSVAGERLEGIHARCLHGGRLMIQARPEHGCVFWERLKRVSDDSGLPQP